MSLVRSADLTVQSGARTSTTAAGSSESIYPVQQDGLAATANGRENLDIYMFLSRECAGGWNPSFKNGQAAVKSIADCLRCVADETHGCLKAVHILFQDDSPDLVDYAIRGKSDTLYEKVELCRILCADTLASLVADMEVVSSRSGRLHAENGPLIRALGLCNGSNHGSAELTYHLQEAQEKHMEILAILQTVVQRWAKLHSQVSLLYRLLNKQLKMLKDNRENKKKLISTNEKDLADYEAKLSQVKTDIEKNKDLLEAMKKEREENQSQPNSIELKDMLELKKIDLEQLRYDKIAVPKEFEAAEREEMQRRENNRKMGWANWTWNALVNPTEELLQVRAWDAKARKHRDEEVARNIMLLELPGEIRALEHQLEKSQHRQSKLSGRQEQLQREYADRQHKLNTELHYGKVSVKAMENEIHRLEEIIAASRREVFTLDEFERIVPELRRNLCQAEANIDLSLRGYNHIVRKLEDYSKMIFRLSQQMRMPSISKDHTKNIFEDVIYLRIIFLVINDMSGHSFRMSRKLYHEDLIFISSLGDSRFPSGVEAGTKITTYNRDNTDKLSGLAGKAAISFDQIQGQSFDRLCPMIENFINLPMPHIEQVHVDNGPPLPQAASETYITGKARRTGLLRRILQERKA